MRKLLAVIGWTAAAFAVLGAALVNPALMSVSGIIAGLAAIAWGLATALHEDLDDNHGFDEPASSRDMWMAGLPEDLELPYRPAEQRPTWDTATWGAPE